jgi:hypothetical protein
MQWRHSIVMLPSAFVAENKDRKQRERPVFQAFQRRNERKAEKRKKTGVHIIDHGRFSR